MQRLLLRLSRDLRQNYDLYIVLAVAIIVILLDLLLQVPKDVLEAVDLAVLGLFAGVLLSLRHRVQTLSKRITALHPTCIELADRESFEGTLDKLLVNAMRVDMLGLSLNGVIQSNHGCFAERADAGCHFRFLVIDPQSNAPDTSIGSVEDRLSSRPQIGNDVASSLLRLETLLRAKKAEVGFSSFAPAFSLVLIDPEEDYGRIQVELYAYGVAPNDRPHFVLSRVDEPWYDFFKHQFEWLWSDSRKHSPSPTASKSQSAGP